MKKHRVELKDGTHSLLFDNWAFYQFEEVSGMSVPAFLDKVQHDAQAFGFKMVTQILWAGLLHEEEYEIKDVAKLFDPSDMQKVADAISNALAYSMGEGDDAEASKKKPKAAPPS